MKRRLPALVLCLALFAAGPLPAQDNGGDNGSGSGDAGGLTPAPGANALGGQSGAGSSTTTTPTQDQTGTGTTSGNGTETGATPTNPSGTEQPPSSITPPPLGPPSFLTPLPASTAASPPSGSNALSQGVLSAPAPVTLSLPGSYGAGEKSFTLGTGRLSKPPILFTVTISQGYDDNINSSPDVPARKAVTTQVEQPLQQRIIGFRTTIFGSRLPIVVNFRPKPETVTLSPAVPAQKPIGSAVTSVTLGVQIQKSSPRTVLTVDGSLGALDYWRETKLQYTGSLGVNLVHRLTPRATFSASVDAVYQNQPDFSRLNAPTSNTTGSYLNGDIRANLTYGWTPRLSTVTSYDLGANVQNAANGGNLYVNTYGNQFRYSVTPRNTVTLELRQSQNTYASASGNGSSDTFALVGLDSAITPRLHNTFSTGEEFGSFSSGGSTALPYFESTTTLVLPRGGLLSWNNRYGLENSNAIDQSTSSFRTTLGLSEPLGAKLGSSLSVAYNYLETKNRLTNVNSNNQTELQLSASLQYLVSPRLSFSLSYTFLEFLSSLPESDYRRNQIFLGATYTF